MLVLLALLPAAAQATDNAPRYAITDLGVPYADGRGRSQALAISNAGSIAGVWSSGTAPDEFGMIWEASGYSYNLFLTSGRTIPRDINDSGQLAGMYTTSSIFDNHAFRFDRSSGRIDLGNLGGNFASANGLNNAGVVVGESMLGDGASRGFVWANGALNALPTLAGEGSGANDINDRSLVVGYSGSRAVMWQGGAATDLGDLGGGSANAQAVNLDGQIAGYSRTIIGDLHAFRWSSGALTDLTPGFSGNSFGFDINGDGDVVGEMSTGFTSSEPFLWDSGRLYDLNSLVMGTGWRLHNARGINDSGQIVGGGWNPEGVFRGYLLTPVSEADIAASGSEGLTRAFVVTAVPEPEIYAMMLVGFALVGAVTRRRRVRSAARCAGEATRVAAGQ